MPTQAQTTESLARRAIEVLTEHDLSPATRDLVTLEGVAPAGWAETDELVALVDVILSEYEAAAVADGDYDAVRAILRVRDDCRPEPTDGEPVSAIRAYLEETRAREGDKGWLRREPKATHPEILEAIRSFRAAGGHFDDDAERYVEKIAGDMPEHHHHGREGRHELTHQLGHEIFIAKGLLRDEELRADLAEAEAAGFRPLDEVDIEAGKRYTIRGGTLYVGQSVPSYSAPAFVRGKAAPSGRVGFVPKGARNFVHIPTPALVKEGW